MNNAKYFILMENTLDVENKDIYDVQIDYLNQGYLNDILKIYRKNIGNEYYLIGKNNDIIIFAIKIILMPIDK